MSSSDVGRFFESPARLKQQQRDMTGLQSQQVAAAACIYQQMLQQQQREGQCVLAPVARCRAVMWGAYVKTPPLKQQREDHLSDLDCRAMAMCSAVSSPCISGDLQLTCRVTCRVTCRGLLQEDEEGSIPTRHCCFSHTTLLAVSYDSV